MKKESILSKLFSLVKKNVTASIIGVIVAVIALFFSIKSCNEDSQRRNAKVQFYIDKNFKINKEDKVQIVYLNPGFAISDILFQHPYYLEGRFNTRVVNKSKYSLENPILHIAYMPVKSNIEYHKFENFFLNKKEAERDFPLVITDNMSNDFRQVNSDNIRYSLSSSMHPNEYYGALELIKLYPLEEGYLPNNCLKNNYNIGLTFQYKDIENPQIIILNITAYESKSLKDFYYQKFFKELNKEAYDYYILHEHFIGFDNETKRYGCTEYESCKLIFKNQTLYVYDANNILIEAYDKDSFNKD